MLVVGAMAATLWGIGAAMGAPRQARLIMLGLLFVAVLTIHVVLPTGHPLREGTGGDARLWLVIGGLTGIAVLYSRVIGAARRRTRVDDALAPTPQSTHATPLGEVELERYARHIVLREIGGPGQTRLKRARVLVVGAGGLGSAALQYLAAAGVGTLGVIDDDVVDHTNLQRQVIHRDDATGLPKAASARAAIAALNPYVEVRSYDRRLTEDIARDLIEDYDLVLDGCDDTATRYVVNAACVALGVPLVSGALSQWEGQVSVFDPARGTPCYACVFPDPPAPGLAPSCAEAGVLGPLPGVVGSMMAVEAVKVITGAGTPLYGRLAIYDALDAETRTISITRRDDCPVCGKVTT
ncbi:MAG: HesA/MoeB/ThiF family protein [Shimia sp.]